MGSYNDWCKVNAPDIVRGGRGEAPKAVPPHVHGEWSEAAHRLLHQAARTMRDAADGPGGYPRPDRDYRIYKLVAGRCRDDAERMMARHRACPGCVEQERQNRATRAVRRPRYFAIIGLGDRVGRVIGARGETPMERVKASLGEAECLLRDESYRTEKKAKWALEAARYTLAITTFLVD